MNREKIEGEESETECLTRFLHNQKEALLSDRVGVQVPASLPLQRVMAGSSFQVTVAMGATPPALMSKHFNLRKMLPENILFCLLIDPLGVHSCEHDPRLIWPVWDNRDKLFQRVKICLRGNTRRLN